MTDVGRKVAPNSKNRAAVQLNEDSLMNTVTVEDVEQALSVFKSEDWFSNHIKEIEDFKTKFAYDGFDVSKFLAYLFKLGGKVGKSTDAIKGDIISLVALATVRGTKITKILGRSKDEGKLMIRNLSSTYQIKDNIGLNARATTVTLGRIASTVPHISVAMFHRGLSSISPAAWPKSEVLSPGAISSVFISTIPREVSAVPVLLFFGEVAAMLTTEFLGGTPQLATQRLSTYKAMHASKALEESARIEVMENCGYLDRYEKDDGTQYFVVNAQIVILLNKIIESKTIFGGYDNLVFLKDYQTWYAEALRTHKEVKESLEFVDAGSSES